MLTTIADVDISLKSISGISLFSQREFNCGDAIGMLLRD
jgi:hypothetical protein